MTNITINPEDRRRLRGKRIRAISLLRLKSGFTNFTSWKGIPFLLLCAAFAVAWNMRGNLVPFDGNSPLLLTIYGYIIAFLIPAVFVLLLAGLLLLLTKPKQAGKMEDCFLQIGLVDHCGYPPTLISRKRVKNTSVNIMVFYSLGIGREMWEKRIGDIQDALNIHFVEPIKYSGRKGRNRNLIVITAAPGAVTRREDTLYDDEI